MLLGNGVAVVMLLLMPKIGPWMQRRFQLQRSIFLRLVLSTHCLALVNLLMSLAEDEISMLVMGAVQSFLNAMVLNTSHSLAAAMTGNRRAWVQLGFLSGALLPVVTTPFTGFGPKSPLLSRVAFYAVPATFCFLIGLLLGVYHAKVKPHLEREPETSETSETLELGGPRGNMAQLAEAYRRFEQPTESAEPTESSVEASPSQRASCRFYVAFSAVLCPLVWLLYYFYHHAMLTRYPLIFWTARCQTHWSGKYVLHGCCMLVFYVCSWYPCFLCNLANPTALFKSSSVVLGLFFDFLGTLRQLSWKLARLSDGVLLFCWFVPFVGRRCYSPPHVSLHDLWRHGG